MTDSISTFFDAWQIEEQNTRQDKISSAVVADVQYHDPRTSETITGATALTDYVGMFSANAPGWTAKVVNSNTIAGVTRATVAFGGPGPDGTEKVQLGQYFVEKDGDLIRRMVGFVGTGSPD